MNDDDLRTLLHDAVDDLQPDDGLQRIRARTSRSHAGSGRWLPGAAAVAAVVIGLTGGTAWFAQQTEGTGGPTSPRDNVTAPGRDLNLAVTYVGRTAAGQRLFTERHAVPDTTQTALRAAVGSVMTDAPRDHDYRNYLLSMGVTARATEKDGAITIDFSGQPERDSDVDQETAELVLQALVWTADDAATSYAPVRFTVKGKAVDSILGVDTSQPIARASADSVAALVSIDSPSEGARLADTFVVRGQASAPEGNVVWQVRKGDRVVQRGFTTASTCCKLAPYSFTVNGLPDGDYTIVVRDTDDSNGEGAGVNEDSKDITVR